VAFEGLSKNEEAGEKDVGTFRQNIAEIKKRMILTC
jgi:hypothetical protein